MPVFRFTFTIPYYPKRKAVGKKEKLGPLLYSLTLKAVPGRKEVKLARSHQQEYSMSDNCTDIFFSF